METVNGLKKRLERWQLFVAILIIITVVELFFMLPMSYSKASDIINKNPVNNMQWINGTMYVNLPEPTVEELEAVLVLEGAADSFILSTNP